MLYSIISTLALILNCIIHCDAYQHIRIRRGKQKPEQQAAIRFGYFLTAANLYFVADIAWGILYEHHDIPGLFPVLYSDCVLYFLFMFLSMLTWSRYIVAYLDKKGRRSKALLYAAWSMFSLALL